MKKVILLAMFIAACASASFAQEKSKVEGFVGFSVNSIDTGLAGQNLFTNAKNRETGLGFDTSVTGYLNDKFGIEGDVDGHFKRKTFTFATCQAIGCPTGDVKVKLSTFNFMGGPHVRFTTSNSKVTPFVHALVGGNHSRISIPSVSGTITNSRSSQTDFALKLGGGIDFGIKPRLDLRLGADYNPVFEKNGTDVNGNTISGHHTRNDAVFSIGVVFK